MRPDSEIGKGKAPVQEGEEAAMLALMALGWIVADARRAERLLALTGLDADALRAGIGEPSVLSAVLAFLEEHEPDLIACAGEIGVDPAALVAARGVLAR